VRDATSEWFDGAAAVVHLAAISNDPLGDLAPDITFQINELATRDVAVAAKAAGVERFLFASSCSLYGAHGNDLLDESAAFHPVTPYGESKQRAEAHLAALADDSFSPTYLRNATVYGASPMLRGDLVVNNLTGFALTTGDVFLKSDGTSWRPLVHVDDVVGAFVAMLEADRELVHDEAFNVGATAENYRIRDVAEIVHGVVPGSRVAFSDAAFDDPRNYRVDFSKFESTFPDARPKWDVERGARQVRDQLEGLALTVDDLEGARLMRIRQVLALQDEGSLGTDLRWTGAGAP
jgi:nucleoside-diphosphate-sugar epimerase